MMMLLAELGSSSSRYYRRGKYSSRRYRPRYYSRKLHIHHHHHYDHDHHYHDDDDILYTDDLGGDRVAFDTGSRFGGLDLAAALGLTGVGYVANSGGALHVVG